MRIHLRSYNLFIILFLGQVIHIAAQTTYCYSLEEGFQSSVPGAPALDVLTNASGQNGAFLLTPGPQNWCDDSPSILAFHFENNVGLAFDNANNFINCAYTVEFLVRFEELPMVNLFDPPWVWLFGTTNDDDGIFIYRNFLFDGIQLEFWDNNTLLQADNFPGFNTQDWFHFTIVRDCNGMVKVFVNCELFTEFNDSNVNILDLNPSEGNQMIFFQDDPSTLSAEASPGFVRNIKISDYAISDQEVQNNCDCICDGLLAECTVEQINEVFTCDPESIGTFSDTIAIAATCGCNCDSINTTIVSLLPIDSCEIGCLVGLQALYRFSSSPADESGNGYDGALLGNASLEEALIIPNDNQSALSIPNTVINGANDFSITLRVNFEVFHTTGFAPINAIISGFAGNNNFGFHYRKNNNEFAFAFEGQGYDFPLDEELQLDVWYCLSVVRRDGIMKVYLDGIQVGGDLPVPMVPVDVATGGLIIGQDQDCLGGCFAANQSLAGSLDNLKIYDRALSDDELGSFCEKEMDSVVICEGGDYFGFTETGIYELNYIGVDGCDSLVVLELTVQESEYLELEVEICRGEAVLIFNQEYSEAGTYRDTLIGGSVNGCDTIVHLDLSLLAVQPIEVIASICAGDSYAVFDQEYTEAGMYRDTLVGGSVNGCDTIVHLDLSLLAVQPTEVIASICTGGGYAVFDQEYTETGMYRDTLMGGSADGCDTIVHLDLSVLAVQPTEVNASICAGGSYTVFDQEYTEAGMYRDTLIGGSANGCDTIVHLDLSLLAVQPTEVIASI